VTPDSTKAYIADRIFTGQEWLHYYAMIVEDGIIRKLIPASNLPAGMEKIEFDDCSIVPAFVDLQIYGAYGKLFASYPEPASLSLLSKYCREGGAVFFLPTIATNTPGVVHKSIDAVREYLENGGEGVLGIHLEGPWINPTKKGAHVESLIHVPTLGEVEALLQYGEGIIRMITLAPEVCSKEIIQLLNAHNIIVSAGHSNATFEQAMHGFDSGISAVTHLFNAMSPLFHREPGLVGATMDHPSVKASIIPDGFHVDYAAIRIALHIMQKRLYVITDAVTETNAGLYRHYRKGDKYEFDGVLSGSALTMGKAVQNLVGQAGVDLEDALNMCSQYPAQLLGIDKKIGWIKKGFQAKCTVLNAALEPVSVIS
jgi:N-acetylglucosamine-6-phosphate deacetylase